MTGRRQAGLLAAARDYIALGWPVFVLSPSKVPLALCQRCKAEHVTAALMEACDCLTCHGFYAASLDPGRVAEMIRLHSRGLLAIRTGAPSGLVVIDVDGPPRAGLVTMRGLVAARELPRTAVQRTGGGGFHFLYGHPGGRIQGGPNKAGPGADVKSDGGYIVAAPSVHPRTGRAYQWLSSFDDPLTPFPDVWIARLREKPRTIPPAGQWRPPVARSGGYGQAALRSEAEKVAATRGGSRNDALNRSAFCLAQLAADNVLTVEEITSALVAAAAANGMTSDDGAAAAGRTIASGLRAGLACPRGRVVA